MDITEIDPAEEAFRHEPEFTGAVHPYSFVRETAAEALGLRYGSLTEDDVHRHPNPDFERMKAAKREIAKIVTGKAPSKKVLARRDELRALIEKLKDEPEEVLTWDGMKRDAVIVLWLCSHPDSICQRARRKPREYEGVIDTWADERGLSGNGEAMQKAIVEFSRIIKARNEGRGVPDIPGLRNEGVDPNE